VRIVREDDTGRRVGRIVETEAYDGPEDRASHARFGRTARNAVMFGPAGVAYVYLVYGMYDCLNVVTGPEGAAAAVLIRAVEPLEGLETMRESRRRIGADRRRTAVAPSNPSRPVPDHRLASGPGLVGAAFGLDRGWTGSDLTDPAAALRLVGPTGTVEPGRVLVSARVGIDYAGEPWASRPWRFAIAGNASVSGPRPAR